MHYKYNCNEVRCMDCGEVLITFCPPLNEDDEMPDDVMLIVETSGHECFT